MPAYDRHYDPPAPVAEVAVGHAVAEMISVPAPGKLDTGAGLTVIPQRMVAAPGAFAAPRGLGTEL